MVNISGNGLNVYVLADRTFPVGFNVTQFADDADPFDFPELQIADTGMGVNGDMVTWTTLAPVEVKISVIPSSDDDVSLATLLEANRGGKNKKVAKDVITMTGIYPDGRTILLNNGVIISGAPNDSVASAGRYKSKTYTFRFENKI